jgi:hypothetical protein
MKIMKNEKINQGKQLRQVLIEMGISKNAPIRKEKTKSSSTRTNPCRICGADYRGIWMNIA